ncbi:MAG: efflux RND transporter permease subunit [Pseudomonadota bacterium]
MLWLEKIILRPKTILTLLIVMVMSGVFAYINLPKEADPDIDVPVFYISIPFTGISPEDAERLLVRPMETELRGLEGLKNILSVASQGHASITLEFKQDVELAEAARNVREKVDKAKAELPDEADEPVIEEINFSLVPVLVVALSGKVPERTLFQHARKLKDEIEATRSVLSADLAGQREELLEVIINQNKIESFNISQQELINFVTLNNQLIAAGSLNSKQGNFNVKVPGLFETAEDVYNLPIKISGDSVVTLRDITEIRRTFKDATGYSRLNGQPAITIQVVKRIGSNIIENNKEVRRVVKEFTKNWSPAINVDFALDRSIFIYEVIDSLQSAIMTAIALVMIIVVAALGIRSALFVGLAIPASFMIGFLLISVLGMTVNMMLMFGMVLTVGILVDGAIVIVEYADRKMSEGLDRKEAYVLAAKRMFWPIVSSTATTLAAFLPMLLWPGTPGEFMSYLPITVIIVLTASLITAMIFLPAIGSLFGATASQGRDVETAKRLAGGGPLDPDKISGFTGIYIRALKKCVRYPSLIIIATAIVVVSVFQLFGAYNNGVEFFVDTEPEQAFVFVSARGNLSAPEKKDLVKDIEQEVLEVKGISTVLTNIGEISGSPVLNGAGLDTPVDEIGRLTVELAEFKTRRRGKVILQEIRDRLAQIPGVVIEVRKVEGGPQTGKAIRLEISTGSFEKTKQVTRKIRQYVETYMTGLRDVEDTTPLPGIEWVLNVDRKEAGRYSADILSVGTLFQLVTNGVLIGKYRPDDADDEVDIRLRLPADQRGIDKLDTLRLNTANGMIPVTNFVTRTAEPKVSYISRNNGRYAMMVKANTLDGVLKNNKITELNQWLQAQEWSEGVSFRFLGADEEEKESADFLGKAMIGALFIMFLILLTQFNSFYQTAITLFTIVLSLVGVLIGMMVTGQAFSIIMTGTGIVALAGIVVNNSIVLIDTYNRHLQAGMEKIEAVLQSCAQRLRPVLLTTITTMLGLLPMALQLNLNFMDRTIQYGSITSIWWVQLSTSIIFGLGFSTLLTLLLTPSLLALPTVWGRAFYRFRSRILTPSHAHDSRMSLERDDVKSIPTAKAAE